MVRADVKPAGRTIEPTKQRSTTPRSSDTVVPPTTIRSADNHTDGNVKAPDKRQILHQNEPSRDNAARHDQESQPRRTRRIAKVDERLKPRIQALIREALAPHFRYPTLAVRRSWQGVVTIGLRVEANGKLANLHVVHSSGFRLLDKAALRSVRKVAHLQSAIEWLKGDDFDIVLPIEYRLLDG